MVRNFKWKKEKPEDFIVSEKADFDFSEEGKFYLYILIKKNFNTKELSQKLGFSYAGLKDKVAITFQNVSFPDYKGKVLFQKSENGFYGLICRGKINKKIKIGNLKGNYFSIDLKGFNPVLKDFMINYFDTQRVEKNWERGFQVLKKAYKKERKWLNRFLVDSFLSFLWNEALKKFLEDSFSGYYVKEKDFTFFIPQTDFEILMNRFPKFLPIPGYKIRLKDKERDIYSDIAKNLGIPLDEIIEKLKILGIKGDYRKTFLKPENIYIKGKRINFFLPKGGYGTMYLKHIL